MIYPHDLWRKCLCMVFERLLLVYNYFSDCQVIVLPSYRDVHHDYVYPQPPFFHQSQNSRMKAKSDYPVITLLKLSLFCLMVVLIFISIFEIWWINLLSSLHVCNDPFCFLPQNVHFMPDPCVVDINNVIFGLTSSDVMFQLGAEEISLY